MKILFVCRQNIGRSQMAKALYTAARPDDSADSAGTVVDVPGQTLKEASALNTIAAMQELGVDVSGAARQQVTQEMLESYDKIIVMSEPDNTPHWLRDDPRTVVWEVSDTKWMTIDGVREMRDEIKRRIVEDLSR